MNKLPILIVVFLGIARHAVSATRYPYVNDRGHKCYCSSDPSMMIAGDPFGAGMQPSPLTTGVYPSIPGMGLLPGGASAVSPIPGALNMYAPPGTPGMSGIVGGVPQIPGAPLIPGAPPMYGPPTLPGGAPQLLGAPPMYGLPTLPGGAPQLPGAPNMYGPPRAPGMPGILGGAPQIPGVPPMYGQPTLPGSASQIPGAPPMYGPPQYPGGPPTPCMACAGGAPINPAAPPMYGVPRLPAGAMNLAGMSPAPGVANFANAYGNMVPPNPWASGSRIVTYGQLPGPTDVMLRKSGRKSAELEKPLKIKEKKVKEEECKE